MVRLSAHREAFSFHPLPRHHQEPSKHQHLRAPLKPAGSPRSPHTAWAARTAWGTGHDWTTFLLRFLLFTPPLKTHFLTPPRWDCWCPLHLPSRPVSWGPPPASPLLSGPPPCHGHMSRRSGPALLPAHRLSMCLHFQSGGDCRAGTIMSYLQGIHSCAKTDWAAGGGGREEPPAVRMWGSER